MKSNTLIICVITPKPIGQGFVRMRNIKILEAISTFETVKFHSGKHLKAPFVPCFLEEGFHYNLPAQGMS
jgi:hypothetical protein